LLSSPTNSDDSTLLLSAFSQPSKLHSTASRLAVLHILYITHGGRTIEVYSQLSWLSAMPYTSKEGNLLWSAFLTFTCQLSSQSCWQSFSVFPAHYLVWYREGQASHSLLWWVTDTGYMMAGGYEMTKSLCVQGNSTRLSVLDETVTLMCAVKRNTRHR
jgi:hypothetical protein